MKSQTLLLSEPQGSWGTRAQVNKGNCTFSQGIGKKYSQHQYPDAATQVLLPQTAKTTSTECAAHPAIWRCPMTACAGDLCGTVTTLCSGSLGSAQGGGQRIVSAKPPEAATSSHHCWSLNPRTASGSAGAARAVHWFTRHISRGIPGKDGPCPSPCTNILS